MKLKELVRGVALDACAVDPELELTGVSCDSRTLEPGMLFAALPGYQDDGQRHIREALERGAAAVLCREAPGEPGPWLTARDPREALALAAANWYGRPAEEMTCLAVTGTNGKTTTTYLLKAVLEGCLQAKVGLIGTNQNLIGEEVLPAGRTTPEPLELQRLLRRMADAGCTHVVMEVSSIALTLRRTAGIRFTAGIFTNLTPDHLDLHGTMEEYRAAKALLFRQCDLAVLNLDDEAGRYYAGHCPCPVFTYSERQDAADLVAGAVPPAERRKHKNPARRTFQAIRIAVNSELDALNEGLDGIFELLAPGGRLCVITFHSLEDRLVKNKFRRWAQKCTCPPELPVCVCGGKAKARLITRRPIEAEPGELAENRRSRSAKLRVLEKL